MLYTWYSNLVQHLLSLNWLLETILQVLLSDSEVTSPTPPYNAYTWRTQALYAPLNHNKRLSECFQWLFVQESPITWPPSSVAHRSCQLRTNLPNLPSVLFFSISIFHQKPNPTPVDERPRKEAPPWQLSKRSWSCQRLHPTDVSSGTPEAWSHQPALWRFFNPVIQHLSEETSKGKGAHPIWSGDAGDCWCLWTATAYTDQRNYIAPGNFLKYSSLQWWNLTTQRPETGHVISTSRCQAALPSSSFAALFPNLLNWR